MVTPIDHVVRIGELLDSLGIRWVLGGSLASSLIGDPRSTMDIDVAIALESTQVAPLVAAVEREYYVDRERVIRATIEHSSFNLIHLATGMKFDLFPLSADPLDARQLSRRRRVTLEGAAEIWVGAADDQVLRKLRWYQMGNEASERQWRDVLSILRVQGQLLDHQQLLIDADGLGLGPLMGRALAELADEAR
jgi:hypothetical protein